ncbi:MAG: DNA repair protein RadC [Desulfobacteraceae bacterium]|nr:MAG: DNA repair protein RadC [Desulfobacteraceae bacterium]
MEKKQAHKGSGHRNRLREKFLESGLSGFHDYEIIELLLTLATPRKDCKDAAKDALERFQSLPGVFEASKEELLSVNGIGPKNLLGIQLIKAVSDRYLEKKIRVRDLVQNSRDLFNYLYQTLRDKSQECFSVIFLDAKNRVIDSNVLFKGTLTESAVYSREVIKMALEKRAAALIFAHNHPSGDPEPSNVDILITKRLLFACKVVGITVHEHIIIGDNRYFSFADQGHIHRMTRECEGNL